ncbi:MAG: ABC transporter substrate-binding protein [Clostridiales bacterium]|nr:ABC transporter substrate-binding protein [Clostridiales bacterium]
MKKLLAMVLSVMMLVLGAVSALAQENAAPIRVYALKGPTGIGMVKVMNDNDGTYDFTLVGAPDEVVSAIVSGNADIAAVPTNLAATLYNKTKGNVQLVALNTLGVLHILDRTGEIKAVEDLAGKTLYATGQGSTPEYAINYILKANGLTDQVTVEYKAEHAELATLAAANQVDIVLLPEPHVTSVLNQNPEFQLALDVTELYNAAAAADGKEGATMAMGCLIVRKDWAQEHPAELQAFLAAYEASVTFVNEDVPAAAQMVQEQEIIPKAAVAQKAIPNCHIVYIAGEEMKTMIAPFFDVLFEANPKSVGGTLPADDFYFLPAE